MIRVKASHKSLKNILRELTECLARIETELTGNIKDESEDEIFSDTNTSSPEASEQETIITEHDSPLVVIIKRWKEQQGWNRRIERQLAEMNRRFTAGINRQHDGLATKAELKALEERLKNDWRTLEERLMTAFKQGTLSLTEPPATSCAPQSESSSADQTKEPTNGTAMIKPEPDDVNWAKYLSDLVWDTGNKHRYQVIKTLDGKHCLLKYNYEGFSCIVTHGTLERITKEHLKRTSKLPLVNGVHQEITEDTPESSSESSSEQTKESTAEPVKESVDAEFLVMGLPSGATWVSDDVYDINSMYRYRIFKTHDGQYGLRQVSRRGTNKLICSGTLEHVTQEHLCRTHRFPVVNGVYQEITEDISKTPSADQAKEPTDSSSEQTKEPTDTESIKINPDSCSGLPFNSKWVSDVVVNVSNTHGYRIFKNNDGRYGLTEGNCGRAYRIITIGTSEAVAKEHLKHTFYLPLVDGEHKEITEE